MSKADLIKSIAHPSEILAMLELKKQTKELEKVYESYTGDLAYAYGMLRKTSRSFAGVIQQLSEELRNAVCIFYLVLRALDTIEDDMQAPDQRGKLGMLRNFHNLMEDKKWTSSKYGEEHEKELLENYPRICAVYYSLKPEYRAVIKDITDKMGCGMADFQQREVVTIEDFDLYCHYVAGLVGHGLSRLFAVSGLEKKEYSGDFDELANSMGLFLQKTNIIRDYLEDIIEGRTFWPREIWGLYAKSLEDFKEPKNRGAAIHCLNHLITNALEHATDCLEYMENLQDPQNFLFCAIPQVMAIATLAELYNNGKVFEGVVKIRKGLAARMIRDTVDMNALRREFNHFAMDIYLKIHPKDPSSEWTASVCQRIIAATGPIADASPKRNLVVSAGVLAFSAVQLHTSIKSRTGSELSVEQMMFSVVAVISLLVVLLSLVQLAPRSPVVHPKKD